MGWASELNIDEFMTNGHHHLKVPDIEKPDDYSFMLPEYIARTSHNDKTDCGFVDVEVLSFKEGDGEKIIAEYVIHEAEFDSGLIIKGEVVVSGYFKMIDECASFVAEKIEIK